MTELAETLSMFARPGIVVDAGDGEIHIKVVARHDPGVDLVTFVARPIDDDWVQQRSSVIQSFDEFNDLATRMVDRATANDTAMVLVQDMYNKGIMLNSHGWIDVLDFMLGSANLDIDDWIAT